MNITTTYDEGMVKAMIAEAVAKEREAMMQLFTDPENQPTQHGTVTGDYMQREIAAEREACAKVCDDTFYSVQAAALIRARGQQ